MSQTSAQRIILGDCIDVFANERNVPAFVSDPPANIGFMGRSWDKANGDADGFSMMLPARSKAHERELRDEYRFTKYWATRYAMAYDIADQRAVNIVWTLPRTSHQTATALRAAGWDIRDNIVHLFGTGWAKTGNALAPGQEGWLLATKGKPDLDIDACRVPRGEGVPVCNSEGGSLWGNENKKKLTGEVRFGSLPKNALLSHCDECVRVGSKRVKGTPARDHRGENHGAHAVDPRTSTRDDVHVGFGINGTEAVATFHCLAGCVCGARTPWPDDRPLPRCPCGKEWRWLCAVAEVNGQSGNRPGMSGGGKHREGYSGGLFGGIDCEATTYADQGGAARFFNTFRYLSKCSSSERHAGCESLYWRADKSSPFGFVQITKDEWEALPDHDNPNVITSNTRTNPRPRAQGNVHPTVKSYRLMHWLYLLTGAKRILDLTAGSGTGMFTAFLDGIEWLGAEVCPEAIVIAEARLAFWKGLSFQAREEFMRDDVVPAKTEGDKLQLSLLK
jgi:hypothetical protein